MTSNRSGLVKEGYMKTKGCLLEMSKKIWVMLFRASDRYECHLKQFKNRNDAMAGVDPEITSLADVELVQLYYANDVFVLTIHFSKGNKKKFAIESESEAYDWYEVLKQHVVETSPPLTQEPHQRYVHASPRGMFNVFLQKNSKTSFSGDYLLQVTGDSVVLHASSSGEIPVVTWKIKALRRYGCSNGRFNFEAGRNAETGEGLFVFHTADADEIYQKVHSAAQALVATGNGNTQHMGHLIQEGDSLLVSQPISKPVPKQKQKPRLYTEVITKSDDDDDKKAKKPRAPLPLPRSIKKKSEQGGFNNLIYTEPEDGHHALIASDEEDLSDFESEEIAYREQRFKDLYSKPARKAEQGYVNEELMSTDYELEKRSTVADGGENTIDLDVYEEKGLTKSFRQFLHLRKEGNYSDI